MDAHIIIAGDSNALGYLNTGPAPYTPTVRVQVWTGTAWNYLDPGVNTGTPANPTAWGPEVQIANRWLAEHPDGILWVVKNAQTVKGGTTLAEDWVPGAAYYVSTTATASAALHDLDGSVHAFSRYEMAFVGLGENDAAQPGMADTYLTNLTAFHAAARDAWAVDRLVEYRITDGAGDPDSNLAVRQAQWQADQADAAVVSFRTIGYAMQADGVHYADHVALGNAIYDGWVM